MLELINVEQPYELQRMANLEEQAALSLYGLLNKGLIEIASWNNGDPIYRAVITNKEKGK